MCGRLQAAGAKEVRRPASPAGRGDPPTGRTDGPGGPQVSNHSGVHTDHRRESARAVAANRRRSAGRALSADDRHSAQPLGLSAAVGPQDQASKKVQETDAIFAQVAAARERAAADLFCLRTSIDTKANVKIGPFSRRGKSRLPQPAADHDMHPDAILVPFCVLEVSRGAKKIQQLNVLFGHSRETADFIVDGLKRWWLSRREHHQGVRRLMIEWDNGPEISSARTQFLKRLVGFADETGLEIELVYLPPYHSKYNPTERGWGVLEQH